MPDATKIRKPTPEQIAALEQFYREMKADLACGMPRGDDFEDGREWVMRRTQIRLGDWKARAES